MPNVCISHWENIRNKSKESNDMTKDNDSRATGSTEVRMDGVPAPFFEFQRMILIISVRSKRLYK